MSPDTIGKKPRFSNILWTVTGGILGAVLFWSSFTGGQRAYSEAMLPQNPVTIQHADGSRANYRMEIAKTPEEQEHGLMFRHHLDAHAGMLFLWPADQNVSMWMKNTLIPLDMLFIAHDGRVVKITANAVPQDLTPLPSGEPIRAVIEIAGGEAGKQHILVGDKVLYPGLQLSP
jgi:uncharacterized membrane protein (UPF0127 family)